MSEENKNEMNEEEETHVEEDDVEDAESVQDGRESDEAEDEDEESPIYKNKLPNRVIVTTSSGRRSRRTPRLQFYVDRARRILRSDETVTISGLGQAISMACTLVEVLKRQQIAQVVSIKTGVDVEPTFAGTRLIWGRPTPSIRFTLKRGPHATYVSDYHQRKVIEIFENKDTNKAGKLDKKTVIDLKMGNTFYANESQEEEAKKYLDEIKDDSLNLPQFIRYSSILIHPLLKDRKFKERLREYGISSQDTQDVQQDGHEEDEEHEE